MTTGLVDIGKLLKSAYQQGADLIGVADLRPAHEYMIKQGGEFFGRFSHAVVIGIKLSNAVLDQLYPIQPADYSLYGFHVYKAVSPLLDIIALRLSQEFERTGFNSLPVPTSQFRSPGERIAHVCALCLARCPKGQPQI